MPAPMTTARALLGKRLIATDISDGGTCDEGWRDDLAQRRLRAVVEVNDRLEALAGQELDSVVERDMSGADVA